MDSVDVSLTEEDKDEKLCTDFNQNKDDIYSNDAGLVFFDEDVINYSSIDEKYISVRNYYSNVSFTVEEIGFSAKYLLSYINSNQRLPATVNVTDVPVSMNDFLYLMCKTLNTTENVDFINFNYVFSTTGTNKPGLRLSKSVYKSLGASIVNCYEINGRNPFNLNYNNITLNFEDAVYFYAAVVRYNYVHGYYVSSVSIKTLTNYDYSMELPALASNINQFFTITANCLENGDGTYNLTLTPSQNATIYYTRNGSLPTTQSKIYNGTLNIYNNTWVRFFGINNKGQTPILSYGVYRASLPYISRNPVLLSSGQNYKIYLNTSQNATIYYTINGTIPTTQSRIYNGSITINNYTLLQYFAVTTSNNKQSSIYYYRLDNPTPYVTILNTTDVRDNHQNVTIIANKPGTIYYTRNGSTPTTNSNIYTSGRIMELSILTQLRAILIDTDNQTSQVLFYQAPQIITPSKAIISVLWDLDENNQMISFDFNKITKKMYYTTDNSNPKNSTTRTLITMNSNWYQSINVPAGKTLKYYTISDEGYVSDVYSYKVPLSQYAIANVEIINFTNIYNDGTQKIGIQMDQSGQKSAIINNEYHFLGACYEINTTEDTIIELEILNNHSNRLDTYVYTRETGLKYRMHYTYTMNIPYQELQIYINSTNIVNFQNSNVINNLNNNLSYFYNFTTKTYSVTSSKYLNYPGMLLYQSGNNITIDFYDYTYGNTNQVSIVKELVGNRLIKISVINNAIKNEIATIYLPDLNYIDCYFKSNNFYKKDYIRDYLTNSEVNGGTLETLQTYILSNQKIDYTIINKTLNKYSLYNKPVFKSAYGTYLTGLTHMYLFNAITTFFSSKLNITTYNYKDTQMRVNIDVNGRTYVDIDDENYGTVVISNNETNYKMYNILGGFYGLYLEGLVLNLAGDNNSYSAIKYFTEDLLNNNLLNFSYNNQTNGLTITTLYNNDYYIYIDEDSKYNFVILNNRYENLRNMKSSDFNYTEENNTELIGLFGGSGSLGYGWNYEETATDNIINFLIEDLNLKIDFARNWFNQLPQNEQELFWEGFNLGEDIAGSILIATAVTTYALSAPIAVPITCACVGVALCFLATGVNSPDDLTNGYYYVAALPSIVLSTICVGSIPTKVTILLGENVLKKLVWSFGNAIYQKTEQLSAIDFIEETIQDQFNEYTYNAFLNSIGLHENRR